MMVEKQIDCALQKLVRFEKMLEQRIFERVDELEIQMYPTMERLHEIPSPEKFGPCEKGNQWGGEGAYCWVRGTYTVPQKLDGKDLYIYPHMGYYEGLLWVDGKPYGNFASKLGNHYCNLIMAKARAGQKIELAIEFYAGHYIPGSWYEKEEKPDFLYQVEGIDICVKNQEILDYALDLKALNQMAEVMNKNSFRRADIVNTLLKVHQMVPYDIDNAEPGEFEESMRQAETLMKEKLALHNSPSAPYAGLIGHSHMDTAWLWTIAETEKKCARTYSNQISLMDQYPEYTFIQSSAFHNEMLRRDYPALFADIQKKVAEGRYEPNGGVWIECDCNITSGESMVRQFLWGQRFTKKYFDYTSDTFWLPDTFGYSVSIPQIMKECGIKYFLTTKMAWNDTNDFPYETFYWKGLDGSKVFAHLNKMQGAPDPKELISYVEFNPGGYVYNGGEIKEKQVSNMRLISYGAGDGGGGPEFEMIEMSRRVADLEGVPRSSHTTVSKFMQQLEATVQDPTVYTGELYLEKHRGTLTNQHTIKRNNRKAEFALHNLEFATVVSAVREHKIASQREINPLMEILLVNQFHDILPGTCIHAAHVQSIQETTAVIEKAGQKLLEVIAPEERKHTISIINTLSFDRKETLYLDVEPGYIVKGVYAQQRVTGLDGKEKLAVSGVQLPAFGSVALELVPGAPSEESVFRMEGNVLETPFARMVFDKEGRIASFIDIKAQRELCGEGYPLNTFLVAEEVSAEYDNWDIDADCEMKFRDSGRLLERNVVADGRVEFRIRSKYQLTARSTLTQDMIFYADNPQVRFETSIDWQDVHRFLKAAFDTSIFTDFARNEVQFGYAKRPTTRNTSEEKAKFEVCNHKYTDLSETRYGAALLNDCKYGISVKDGQMRLSLHKGGCRPDDQGDKGVHICSYAFLPHEGGFCAENVIQPAYAFNAAPVQVEGQFELSSLAKIDAGNIIIETVKPCEDEQRAYILRMYEAEGAYTRTRLCLAEDAEQICVTNMLEETKDGLTEKNQIPLVFRPFEIKTLKISY